MKFKSLISYIFQIRIILVGCLIFLACPHAKSQELNYIKFISKFSKSKADGVRIENIYTSKDSLNWKLQQQTEYDTLGKLIRLKNSFDNVDGYGTTLFYYDSKNRLIKIVDSVHNLLYRTGMLTYDLNNHLREIKYTNNPGNTTRIIQITEFKYTFKNNLLFQETYLHHRKGERPDTNLITIYDSLGRELMVKDFNMRKVYYFHWNRDNSSMIKTHLIDDGTYEDTVLVEKYEKSHLVESYNPNKILETKKIFVWKENKLLFSSGESCYDITNFFDSCGLLCMKVSTINPSYKAPAIIGKLPLIEKRYFKYSTVYFER